ncbi:hypothetical protein [Halospeciosus flavus]|uniref:CR-type domain-containing protein n=1 Tax=Halospeciosus flavus TaxID=3032283 RepID=A0ABD5Z209_9EURY|nr:hypothetical protein [Halospeciosus flavus]
MSSQSRRPEDVRRASTSGSGVADGDAARLLSDLADDWKVPDDLANSARVDSVVTEECDRIVETSLRADDRVETRQFAESEYRDAVAEREPLDGRYDATPSDFRSTSVAFVERDADERTCPECVGDRTVDCPDCHEGEVDCSECNGRGVRDCECEDGRVDCEGCDGDGRVEPNSGSVECDNCGGDGDFTCPSCDGTGRFQCPDCRGEGKQQCLTCAGENEIDCETCEAEGYVYEAKAGTVDFAVDEQTRGVSERGMPEAKVERAQGRLADERTSTFDPPIEGGEGVVRKTVETFAVPTTRVEYTYDGDYYEVYEVDGETHAPSHPKSEYYEYAPYAGVAASVAFVFWMLLQLV